MIFQSKMKILQLKTENVAAPPRGADAAAAPAGPFLRHADGDVALKSSAGRALGRGGYKKQVFV